MPENDETPAPGSAGAQPANNAASVNHENTDGQFHAQQLPNITRVLDTDGDFRRHELCDAALGYAAHGWRVIPVRWINEEGFCSCPKGEECPSPGKHPVHDDWPNVASCDPMQVAHWWRPEPPVGDIATEWWPEANIGIVTGRDSGVWVLDEDTYAGGNQTIGQYERRHGALPATRVHSTGSGGTHYFWRHPGFEVRNSARKVLGQGLDIRGEHGFVVAPPSMGAKGAYELNAAHDIAPVDAPGWLLDLIRSYDRDQLGASVSGTTEAAPNGASRKYAEAALRAEAQRMREAEAGTRNDTLNQCAFSLGTLGGNGLLDEADAWTALSEAASAAGLSQGEIRGTFLSGWRKGVENPRVVQWNALEGEWETHPRTEFGLADRMLAHYGDQLRWCPERGTWMTYRGGVWVTDVKQTGLWMAQMMIRRLPETEALSYDDTRPLGPKGEEMPSPRDEFIAWVGKQQTQKAVSAAANLAAGLTGMRMSQNTFDAESLLLNVTNGVVNLNTGELEPHSPEQRMTLQSAAPFHGLDELAPQWDAFLARVQPDPAMRAYLQRVIGYASTALTTEQAFFLLTGKGANGKSVFESVIGHVLGSYSQTVPVETLMASSVDGRIPNDIARMAGRRFMSASETKAGKALDEQRLKQLTGGDTIAARYMRAEFFEFRPVGKFFLTTNHLPKLSDDSATWRRIHLIRWPVTIPEGERDGFLQDRLIREEAAGILAWIVRGALAWREEGLNPPDEVHQAREEYQRDEDVVGQFVEDCLNIVPPVKGAVGRSSAEIWNAFAAWAKREGHPVMGQRALTGRLKKNYTHARSNGWSGFPELEVRMLDLPLPGS